MGTHYRVTIHHRPILSSAGCSPITLVRASHWQPALPRTVIFQFRVLFPIPIPILFHVVHSSFYSIPVILKWPIFSPSFSSSSSNNDDDDDEIASFTMR